MDTPSPSSQITVGIIGGGQLGRMLTQAAQQLNIDVICLDPGDNCPAAQVGATQIVGELSDADRLYELASQVTHLTWEIEHFDVDALEVALSKLESPPVVNPKPSDLRIIADKLIQKEHLASRGVAVPRFAALSAPELPGAINQAGMLFDEWGGLIVKSRRGGFDGRGNAVVRDRSQIEAAIADLSPNYSPTDLYVEELVNFDSEVSVLIAKSDTLITAYDLVTTVHEDNICHTVSAPAQVSEQVMAAAFDLGKRVAQGFEGSGVFAIEMFVTANEEQLVQVNEIAPRVHNSGHHTIEACETSQFENHIRGVCGLRTGFTQLSTGKALMLNILGTKNIDSPELPPIAEVDTGLEEASAYIHWYGKAPVKEARKMGHINVVSSQLDSQAIEELALNIRAGIDV